jgi:hypothetical protein
MYNEYDTLVPIRILLHNLSVITNRLQSLKNRTGEAVFHYFLYYNIAKMIY